MKETKLIAAVVTLVLTGCASDSENIPAKKVYQEGESLIPVLSKQKRLEKSIENDYEMFRALNHKTIKSNTEETQLRLLQQQIGNNVMDLISNLTDEDIIKPVIIRPVNIGIDERYDSKKGQLLLESLLELHLSKYGFTVFNDRRPKGRLTGEEFVLETEIIAVNDKIAVQTTLKLLNSNKMTSTKQDFISNYFFKNIQDGVEVWTFSRTELNG